MWGTVGNVLLFLFFIIFNLLMVYFFLRTVKLKLFYREGRVDGVLQVKLLGFWVMRKTELFGIKRAASEYKRGDLGESDTSRVLLDTLQGETAFGELYTNLPKERKIKQINEALHYVRTTGKAVSVSNNSFLPWLVMVPILIGNFLFFSFSLASVVSFFADTEKQSIPQTAENSVDKTLLVPSDFPKDAALPEACHLYQISRDPSGSHLQLFGKTSLPPSALEQKIRQSIGSMWREIDVIRQSNAVAIFYEKKGQLLVYTMTQGSDTDDHTCNTDWKNTP